MLNQHAINVTGHRFNGANPSAEISPAISAMSFGYRVTLRAIVSNCDRRNSLRYRPAMFILYALAAITPVQSADITCVAQLAIVASEQKRGTGWGDYPDVGDDGADFAAVVGDEVMTSTGQTKEQVRDQILAAVATVQKSGKLDRAEVDKCAILMHAKVPTPLPPTMPRCAAIMALSYEAVKTRDGLTKDAKDLATLASVLTYRAKEELISDGKSEAEADALIGTERAKAAKAGGAPESELRTCAGLAAPAGAQ